MKRSAPKRKLGRYKKPLRRVSTKRAKINRKAAIVRAEFCRMIERCELCDTPDLNLCAHEIPRSARVTAFTEPAAMLALCHGCHAVVHAEPKLWPKVRQAALLYLRRPGDWDLQRLNELLIAKLEQWAVDAAACELRMLENQWRG